MHFFLSSRVAFEISCRMTCVLSHRIRARFCKRSLLNIVNPTCVTSVRKLEFYVPKRRERGGQRKRKSKTECRLRIAIVGCRTCCLCRSDNLTPLRAIFVDVTHKVMRFISVVSRIAGAQFRHRFDAREGKIIVMGFQKHQTGSAEKVARGVRIGYTTCCA